MKCGNVALLDPQKHHVKSLKYREEEAMYYLWNLNFVKWLQCFICLSWYYTISIIHTHVMD